jgi:hypothetical protein
MLVIKRSYLLGVQKSEGVPEHKSYESKYAIYERQGDKESPKACTHLKSCEPLYMCPRAPFYRDTKGILHSRLPSNLGNIPSVNMDKNVFYIP